MSKYINTLVVDDEPLNLEIIGEYLEDGYYNPVYANDGDVALERLKEKTDFDVIVLDRMMPRMDGMQFLKVIKQDKNLRDIPVIMQTAANTPQQIAEGIENGVYYYLSKPYTKQVFLSIVNAAYDDFRQRLEIRKHIKEYGHAMSMISEGKFNFSTPEQAKSLAVLIGSCAANSEGVMLGLTELMLNAVEHGNLGFTYEEKRGFKLAGTWDSELQNRLFYPEYKSKVANLSVIKNQNMVSVTIEDQGAGFDWEKYTKFDSSRLMDPNGRGLLMIMSSGFKRFEYKGKGNIVECVFEVVAG